MIDELCLFIIADDLLIGLISSWKKKMFVYSNERNLVF